MYSSWSEYIQIFLAHGFVKISSALETLCKFCSDANLTLAFNLSGIFLELIFIPDKLSNFSRSSYFTFSDPFNNAPMVSTTNCHSYK